MNKMFYELEFNYFFNKIKNNEHFKYSRFNDGEIIAINSINNNTLKSNCDGHLYYPDMGKKLKIILETYNNKNNYYLESYKYWYDNNKVVKLTLDKLYNKNNNLKFLSYDFIRITHENNSDDFINLLKLLKNKNVIIVGPSYLKQLKKHFNNFNFIEIPIKNCYLSLDSIINDIKNVNNISSNNIFLLSASMPANIIIDEFKNDTNNSYIDFGSVWDTFFVSKEYNFIKKRSSSNKIKIINKYKRYLI